jgi:Glutathione S-transferase, C-terminal domain
LLDKNGSEGETLVMGNKVSFSDFVIASCLETIFLVYPEEWEERVGHWDNGRWVRLRDHCAGWREVH